MRRDRAAAAGALATGLLVLGGGTSAHAAPVDSDCSTWNSSVLAHPVIGVPRLDNGRGAIEVRVGSKRMVLTRSALRLGTGSAGDRLGAAISTGFDYNEDECTDIAVGAPGVGGAGVVYVFDGTPQGLGKSQTLRLPDGRRGDQFGSSISVALAAGDIFYRIVVGAPGRDVGGVRDAGSIAWFNGSGNDLQSTIQQLSQASPGVTGTPEPGDRFGEVLSASFDQGFDVLVGVPREDVGSVEDAGVVLQLAAMEEGPNLVSTVYRQRAGGPMGAPERGDRFGTTVAFNRNILAVGVPGEDVGHVKDAGAVNLLQGNWQSDEDTTQVYRPLRSITQGSSRVPGTVEGGDLFGASVVEMNYFCPDESETARFAIGAPGENVGRIADAGAVTLYDSGRLTESGSAARPCPSWRIRQGALAGGAPEAGDRLGTALAKRGELFNDLGLLITVPGEDVSGVADAGLVAVVRARLVTRLPSQQLPGGPRARLQYATLPAG